MVKGLKNTKLAQQALDERVRAEQQRTEACKKLEIQRIEETKRIKLQRIKRGVKALRKHANRNRDIKLFLKGPGVDPYIRRYWEKQLPEKSKSFFKI